jgi:hypothetical protein
MARKQKDRHLDVPAEANRDRHINFLAGERNEMDPAEEPRTGALAEPRPDSRTKTRNKKRKRQA